MSLNYSLNRTLKSILQDSVIRIPFFASTIKSTSTIAVLFQSNNGEKSQNLNKPNKLQKRGEKDYLQIITNKFTDERGIIGHQWKLYYEKDICFKSIIIQFENVQSAERFYFKYSKNFDKSLLNESLRQNERKQIDQAKYILYFCKDITSFGVNMEQILYRFGKISVQIPQSAFLKSLIKQVAKLIVVEGIRGQQQLLKYRSLILSSTSSQNLLDFMDPKFLSSESTYYRWRVYSYLQGDGENNYRQQPYQMTTDGPIFYPPTQLSQKYMYKILTHQQRQYITKLLQTLSSRKFHIEQAMSFCINNISNAIQICCIISICIVQSCKKLSGEQIQNKINRSSQIKHLIGLFYLISDILFNSVSTVYRDLFTVILPSLIQKLPNLSQLNAKILEIVETWNKKFILEDQFLQGILLLVKRQLPSMKPLGMQQMTRSQHQCYKNLIKIETSEEIQQLCWKYGIVFSMDKIAESYRNLAAIMAKDYVQDTNQMQPQIGIYDGQPLNQKDLLKIKTKGCRVVSCEDISVKYLFDKDRTSKSYQN